jgi:crotonobetainyl-CoA:carnitine CoA-transferase CaiB-like acyl-CoA transferase
VPHAPVLGINAALAHPQAIAREMVVEAEHPILGRIPIVNRSIRFVGANQPVPTAPPVLGQHTDEILERILGYDSGQIAELRTGGVVA